MGDFLPIGERLRKERERLGQNQTDFAAVAGVTRKTLFGYEAGARAPDAGALESWAALGLDVLYVVTGSRANVSTSRHLPGAASDSNGAAPHHLPPDEQLLLEAYRGLTAPARKALLAELLTGSTPKKPSRAKPAAGSAGKQSGKGAKQVFHGPVGQAVEGGITNHQGVTFNVGNGKSKE